MIVTATEGSGKSEMLRHLALCVSVGVHPFTLAACQPRTVLIVDAENEKSDVDTSWKWLFRVTTKLGHPDVGKLHAVMLTDPADRPDLTDAHGRAALMRNIERIQPELVCLGPLYKLVSSDLTDRASVRYFRDTIDQAREICDSAFVIEHHAPHRMSGAKERELRPIGSSELMRWPDFGFAIVSVPSEDEEKLYEWKPWRGGRKRDRQWPSMLREGKPGTLELPWVAHEDVEGSVNVKQSCTAYERRSRSPESRQRRCSGTGLSDRLEVVATTGIPTDTCETLLAACDEWRAVRDELGRCPQESPYEVFPEEWAVFDRATAELVYRMRRWIKASLTLSEPAERKA